MNELKSITTDLLSLKGAEIDDYDEAIEVLLPESLQKQLNLPEIARLYFDNTITEDGFSITLESDWIEKFTDLLGNKGKTCFINPTELKIKKNPDPERIIAKELIFKNAICRLKNCEETFSCYSALILKSAATSDEKKEDMLIIPINESNGLRALHLSEILIDSLNLNGLETYKEFKNEFADDLRLTQIFLQYIESDVKNQYSSFLNAMERRMGRDLDRIWQYYTDMQTQILEKTSSKWKKGKVEELRMEEQKIASIEREYLAKVSDISRKYSIEMDVKILQMIRTRIPVYRIELEIHRRKNIRKIHLDYNFLSKKSDSIVCEFCHLPAPVYEIDDDTMKIRGNCCA